VREVSEAAPLLTLLRKIRRRLRLWMALEGAVVGAAAGAIALALAVAAAHLAGHVVGAAGPAALLAAGVAIGALVRGAPRIPLSHCARFADAALDGHDRVLSAFTLRDDQTPLARALVIDAAARARTLAPGGAVTPRRPKGLPALALGAIVLAAAAVAPVRSRAARVPSPRPEAPGVPLAASALDVEREAARRAAADAQALHDERLGALAGELDRTLRRLAAGQLTDGDALEKLAALQRQAAEAAEQAAREAKALAAAKQALVAEAATRGAGEALASDGDGDAGARARAALGAAAADSPKETARALAAAAQGVANASASGDGATGQDNQGNKGNKEQQRRLSREGDQAAKTDDASRAAANGEHEDRRLERLQRNLQDASNACRDGDPSCRSQAEKRGDDLAKLAGRQASADALRRLERALRQARDRLGRGEVRDGEQSGMRGFERAARGDNGQDGQGRRQGEGQRGKPGEAEQGDGVGQGGQGSGLGRGDSVAEGEKGGQEGQHGQEGRDGKGADGKGRGASPGDGDGDGRNATGEAATVIAERETREISSGGDGAGSQAGGKPLGRRGDMQTRGHEAEARVANGAGPNRAQVIGGAADRGFAQRDYARVFSDYQAAVEDALATTAVPEGRRYVVRRYFDLIRPRVGSAQKAGK
jgi:hypothetical protein